MTEAHTQLPKWVLIVSALVALMELLAGTALFVSPDNILETVDLDAKGVLYVVQIWATRQFALGCAIGFAALKRSAAMLTVSFIFLLVMFLGDLLVGVMQHNNGFIVTAIVMSILSALLLRSVNNHRKQA